MVHDGLGAVGEVAAELGEMLEELVHRLPAAALERFAEALALHLPRRLSIADARALGLPRAIEGSTVGDGPPERARRRLVQVFDDAWQTPAP